MEFTPAFVLTVLGMAEGSGHNSARMRLIVKRPYAHLEDRLRRAFEGREDIEVIVDRRRGQRRMSDRPVQAEQRRTDRRTSREEILEILIEGDPLTLFR
jgi:hypothetical protein